MSIGGVPGGGQIERNEHEGTVVWGRRDRGAWSLTIALEPDSAPDHHAEGIEAEWARLCAQNPRLFNGPMLSVTHLDPLSGLVRARRDWYKRLVADPDTPVELLSVIGVVVARREGGGVCTLMGRRGRDTRLYGRRWELAPAGGIDPPTDPGARTIERHAVLAQLAQEMREEVGLEARVGRADLIAAVRNPEARSLDLVVLIEPEETVEALRARARAGSWEYERMLWLPIRQASRFVRTHGHAMTPQTKALLGFLGWTDR